MKLFTRLTPFIAGFAPMLAFAQSTSFGRGLSPFFREIVDFINETLVPFIFAIAFLIFVWGVFKYFILGGGDSTKQEEGKQFMLYGIAGFVIMVSVWGIVNLLASGLGLENRQEILNVPEFRFDR